MPKPSIAGNAQNKLEHTKANCCGMNEMRDIFSMFVQLVVGVPLMKFEWLG